MGIQSTKKSRMKKGGFIQDVMEANLAEKAIFD
jgi:hypothetical protein